MRKLLKLIGILVWVWVISAEITLANTTTATYTVTFESTWSQASHNPNSILLPSSAHWSRLVGTTHKTGTTFWQSGSTATNGIRRMAEWGWNGPLNGEVDTAIAAGNAHEWIQFPSSLGSAAGMLTMDITVQPSFPQLTLVSMIAPSPDWFIGISGLDLQDENGNWIPAITVDLYPYDAGTDAGTTFTSGDIEDLGNPISNLQGVTPFNSDPIGTLTLTQQLTPTAVTVASAEATTPTPWLTLLSLLFLSVWSVGLFGRNRQPF